MEHDVIISAYATPPPSAGVDAQPLTEFEGGEPLVIQVVPGSGNSEAARFGAAASRLRDHTGSILKPLLRQSLPKGDTAGRVALISFSAGWGFASAVINGPDREWLDALILVDSFALPRTFAGGPIYITPGWREFIDAAGEGAPKSPLLVSSSVSGIPPLSPLVASTRDSTLEALDLAALRGAAVAPAFDLAKLVAPGSESWPVTIHGGNPPTTEVFSTPPQPEVRQAGNVVGCLYPGKGGPAHIFQAWHVQPRLIRTFLAPWWKDVPCEQPLQGLGAVEECGIARRAPADVVGAASSNSYWGWAAGAALAVGVGWGAARWLR